MQKRVWAVVASLAGMFAIESEAAASWTLSVIDDSGDCGRRNEIALTGSTIRIAWLCEDASGSLTVKTAKGPTAGGTFPKILFGAGTGIDVASNGTVAFTNGQNHLRFAREVALGTGNCGNGNGWECETVVAAPVEDPQISSTTGGQSWLAYRQAGKAKLARRTGINAYTLSTVSTIVDPVERVFIDAGDSTISPYVAWNGDASAFLDVRFVYARQVAGGSSLTPCLADIGDPLCNITAFDVNPGSHQPSFLIDDKIHRRIADGTWRISTYAVAPQWATGLDDRFLPCISRGGDNGLILTCLGLFTGWENELVDGSTTVHTSSLVIHPTTGLRFISYYDATNERLMLAREVDD